MGFYAFCAWLSHSRALTFMSDGWDLHVHTVKRAALIVEIIVSRIFSKDKAGQSTSYAEVPRLRTTYHGELSLILDYLLAERLVDIRDSFLFNNLNAVQKLWNTSFEFLFVMTITQLKRINFVFTLLLRVLLYMCWQLLACESKDNFVHWDVVLSAVIEYFLSPCYMRAYICVCVSSESRIFYEENCLCGFTVPFDKLYMELRYIRKKKISVKLSCML